MIVFDGFAAFLKAGKKRKEGGGSKGRDEERVKGNERRKKSEILEKLKNLINIIFIDFLEELE